mmetsp:Transcript_3276/g.8791  ORF Transcript_3276/g.8791 Transcript_3276/m.8791 type:complete len:829 (+) Transcript_3276:1-2487(+)
MKSCLDLMYDDAKEVHGITSKIKNKSTDNESNYATKLKQAMTALDTHISLHKGIPVKRITSKGVWKSRVITLSSDKQAFFITHQKLPNGFSSHLASTLSIPLCTPSKGFRWSNDKERYVRHIDVADIVGWQVGVIGVHKLEVAKNPVGQKDVENMLTIFYHGFKSICFIVPDKKIVHLMKALKRMKKRYNLMSPWTHPDQLLLRYIYYDIDVDKSGTIDLKEFRDICKRINFTAPTNIVDIYSKYSKGRREISIEKALELLRAVAIGDTAMPAEIVWNNLFGKETNEIGPKLLLERFLLGSQGEYSSTNEDAGRFITCMKSLGKSKSSEKISKEEFVHFLHSKYNDVFDPAAVAEPATTQKLDLSLSKYWINSSHNTYLLGDQLQSRSSVEAYQNALQRGSKCLEFDCWDGVVDNDTNECVPVIYHGHTMTSKITFRSACLVTNNYLIANPDTYPIILSLENHCSLPYQKVMAKDMKKIFGKKLFIPTEKQFSGDDLPSPEELRGMVIIKGKRPPEPDDEATVKSSQRFNDYSDTVNQPESTPSLISEAENNEGIKSNSKVDSELRELTLLHGAKYKNFHLSMKQTPSTMHSIGETKIPKLVRKSEESATLWRQYNCDHMTRTYPAGTRVDSSNYNPILAWATGSQLVALNFQTTDSNLALNDGLFRQAGKCGYIPKPASVMGGPKPEKKTLKISVLSARCIPKPRGSKKGELIDPYVEIDLHDVRIGNATVEEHVKETFTTSTVNNNGFCPVWKNGNLAEFEVHNPDAAMIHFRIIDDDIGANDKIASSAIPFSCVRKGYRSVQLYDEQNTRAGPFESSSLFVKIEY